jgi:hypothetical protein
MRKKIKNQDAPVPRYKHSLIIGGTGMLAGATVEMCGRSDRATVVSRHAEAFAAERGLAENCAVTADYRDAESLIAAIEARITRHGAFDAALLWFHGAGEKSLLALLDVLDREECAVVMVLGSAQGDPRRQSGVLREKLAAAKNLSCRRAVLGCKADGNGWRWLTDEEISRGALDALAGEADVMVGELPAGKGGVI